MMMSLAFVLLVVYAEDKEMPVRKHGFVDAMLENHTQMDEPAQKALKEFLSMSKCSYVSPKYQRSGKEAQVTRPEMFSIPAASCGSESSAAGGITYCGAAIVCENRNTHYKILDAFCRSVTASSCPPAKDCALASHLTRSLADDDQPSRDGKQKRLIQQDPRGWDTGHVNRYSWAIADEIDMDRWEKEAANKKSDPNDRAE